jgi:imidazolonepropionase
MIGADLVVRNVGLLATLKGPVPRVGPGLRDLGAVEGAALAAADGRLVWVGPDADLFTHVRPFPQAVVIDAEGAAVLPGLVDPHTHLAFAGNRDDEVRRRLAGESYQSIAAGGGGIVRTVEATRAARREDLARDLRRRLDEALCLGTTTVEVKSGYGLTTADEVKLLQAIQDASAAHAVTVVPTFLGAHEVPPEHRGAPEAYVRLLVEEMIPEVARQGLAAFCDVFCERGVFSLEDSRRILRAAQAHGMKLRLHADELSWTGGAELAGELKARSADHLVRVSAAGARALADTGCAATLLPAAAFYLRLGTMAPARALINAGAPVALATDANPGGGLSPSMPFAMTVACFGMGLSVEEAIAASTINAAWSLDLHREVGSLEVGKRADLVLLRSARLLDLLRAGVNAIGGVVKNGRLVVQDGRREA